MSKDKEFAMSEIMNSYEEEREKMGMVFGLEPLKSDLLAVVKEAEEIRIFDSQTEAEAEYELL